MSQVNMFKLDINEKFLCIEFPGIVVNNDKALQCLGGIDNLATVYYDKKRRMELRFRPNDVYCKPACGDRHKATAVLLEIKIKSKKSTGEIAGTCVKAIITDTVYKFSSLCDFQYVPLKNNRLIYDQLVPNGLLDVSWLQGESDIFLPPAAFSRIDTMQSYYYRNNTQDKVSNKIAFIRKPRNNVAGYFISWNDPIVPEGPKEMPPRKIINETHLNELKKIFEERPIWSKNALNHILKIHRDQLKLLLPLVAYYFTTGPWRVMWVKYGYDPRTESSAKIYQTLDYRLPSAGGLKTTVNAKRSYTNYILPYKSSPIPKPKAPIINMENDIQEVSSTKRKSSESEYIFRTGMIPPSRQMFYQYCDLHVPEIQDMLMKLPKSTETKCDGKLGWLPIGMEKQCREIIHEKAFEAFHNMRKTDTSKLANISNKDDEDDGSDNSDSDYEDVESEDE